MTIAEQTILKQVPLVLNLDKVWATRLYGSYFNKYDKYTRTKLSVTLSIFTKKRLDVGNANERQQL